MSKKRNANSFDWKVRKYSRWLRLYLRRVHTVENEMGGPIDCC